MEPPKGDGMTVAIEEFAKWRDSVEARLGRLEGVSDEHAGKIRHDEHLLGSMDRDLSKLQAEFRAQRGMLQALHLTQNEHTAKLMKLEIGQEELRRGQQELRQGQVKVLAGVQTIIGLLSSASGVDS
jgi:chromosome segregation ATPase